MYSCYLLESQGLQTKVQLLLIRVSDYKQRYSCYLLQSQGLQTKVQSLLNRVIKLS